MRQRVLRFCAALCVLAFVPWAALVLWGGCARPLGDDLQAEEAGSSTSSPAQTPIEDDRILRLTQPSEAPIGVEAVSYGDKLVLYVWHLNKGLISHSATIKINGEEYQSKGRRDVLIEDGVVWAYFAFDATEAVEAGLTKAPSARITLTGHKGRAYVDLERPALNALDALIRQTMDPSRRVPSFVARINARKTFTPATGGRVHVKGHYRKTKSGKRVYVKPHTRSKPRRRR